MRLVSSIVGSLWVFDQDRIGRVIEETGAWDAHLLPWLDRADRSGVAIDLGAHVGFFSRYLSYRHHCVLAVEAASSVCVALRENCTYHGIHIYNVAAFDRACTLWLVREWLPIWGLTEALDLDTTVSAGCLTFLPTPDDNRFAVPAVPVDQLVPPDARVSLIKSDVQGCDLRALRGLEQTIRRDRPLIVFEYEPEVAVRLGETWDDYLRFFATLDYHVSPIALTDYVAEPV